MKELLTFLIENITGSDKFEVEELSENGTITMSVKADSEIMGLIIGKGGKTVKNLRKILSVRAVLEEKSVSIDVNPLQS